ncbi:MAG: hypothetical protein ACTH54_09835 [Vagococcus salmoninarum]|uniref:hypothetical protein n=1 Tax=Vagococcus salmoninarum TaxID=2739 RepID=UPI003F9E2EBA
MIKGKNKNKRKRVLAVTAAAALCTLLLSTFAWEVYKAEKENKFGNALSSGSIEIEEIFPDPMLEEGAKLQKDVWTVNTSSSNTIVRLTFEEIMNTLNTKPGEKEAIIKQFADTDLDPATHLPTVANADTKGYIPVVMDNGYYVSELKKNTGNDPFVTWADVTSDMTGAPADVTILAKANKVDITAVGGSTEYRVDVEYVAFRKFDLTHTNMGDVSKDKVVKFTDPATGTINTAFVAQQVNSKNAAGKTTFKAAYDASTGAITGYSFTDLNMEFYDGLVRSGVANWAAEDLHIGPGTEVAKLPALSAINKSSADANVDLYYSAFLKADASENTWMYNENDGFFYYMGVVGSGSYTNPILSHVGLGIDLGTKYDYLDYSLWVDAEAVLPKKEAVLEQFFGGTVPTAEPSLTIYNKLVTLADANTPVDPDPLPVP